MNQNDKNECEWLTKMIMDRCEEITDYIKTISAICPDDIGKLVILKDKLAILKDLETITETRMRKKHE